MENIIKKLQDQVALAEEFGVNWGVNISVEDAKSLLHVMENAQRVPNYPAQEITHQRAS